MIRPTTTSVAITRRKTLLAVVSRLGRSRAARGGAVRAGGRARHCGARRRDARHRRPRRCGWGGRGRLERRRCRLVRRLLFLHRGRRGRRGSTRRPRPRRSWSPRSGSTASVVSVSSATVVGGGGSAVVVVTTADVVVVSTPSSSVVGTVLRSAPAAPTSRPRPSSTAPRTAQATATRMALQRSSGSRACCHSVWSTSLAGVSASPAGAGGGHRDQGEPRHGIDRRPRRRSRPRIRRIPGGAPRWAVPLDGTDTIPRAAARDGRRPLTGASALVRRAPVGGAPAHRLAGGAARRRGGRAVPPASGLELSGVGAAPLGQLRHRERTVAASRERSRPDSEPPGRPGESPAARGSRRSAGCRARPGAAGP